MKKGRNAIIARFGIAGMMLVLMILSGASDAVFSVAASIVIVIVMVSFLRSKHPERHVKDERTKKLEGYALSWSWIVTYIFIAILFWVDYLGMVALTATQTISIVFFAMTVIMLVFRAYCIRKGDI